MDLWRLKIFRKVIELKSFSRASEAINLSQPTVSSHIKDLERHFDCKLIDRLGKKAVPTKAGELLYYYAGKLQTLYEETETAIAAFHGNIRGRLVIGGSTIPGGYILPQIIGKFTNVYPEVIISLVVGDTKKIINEILSGKVELGIVGAKSANKRISYKKVLDDEMRLIIPGDHRWAGKNSISIECLIREPFIIRESGSGTLISFQKSLSSKGLTSKGLNIVAELGSTGSVIQGIKSGIGVSILSTIAVAEELQTGTLKALTINGLNLKRKFYMVRHKNRSETPLGSAFRKFIENKTLHYDI